VEFRIEGYGGFVLDLAAREAVKAADYHDGVEDAQEPDVSRCEPPIAT
jgi:hypothetical protein